MLRIFFGILVNVPLFLILKLIMLFVLVAYMCIGLFLFVYLCRLLNAGSLYRGYHVGCLLPTLLVPIFHWCSLRIPQQGWPGWVDLDGWLLPGWFIHPRTFTHAVLTGSDIEQPRQLRQTRYHWGTVH